MKWLKHHVEFLNENFRTRSEKIDVEKFEEIYNENCKIHKMLRKDPDFEKYQLWRGARSDYKFSFIDPKLHTRWSIENENIHVAFMSDDSSWSDFPPYNMSLIGSLNYSDASGYSRSTFEVIPFDGAKIAICPQPTIWESFGGFSDSQGIRLVSHFLESVGIKFESHYDWYLVKGEIESFGKFYFDPLDQYKKLKTDISSEFHYSEFINDIETDEDYVTSDQVIEKIEEIFSPKDFKLITYDENYIENFNSILNEKNLMNPYLQFWTDSECLLRKF